VSCWGRGRAVAGRDYVQCTGPCGRVVRTTAVDSRGRCGACGKGTGKPSWGHYSYVPLDGRTVRRGSCL